MPISSKRLADIAAAIESSFEAGRSPKETAEALGIQLPTMRVYVMSAEFRTKYPQHFEVFLLLRLSAADKALDDARDHVEVTKRSHQCRYARFDLERRLPGWGPKSELTVKDDRPPPDPQEVIRRLAFIRAEALRLAAPATTPHPSRPAQPIIDVDPLVDQAVSTGVGDTSEPQLPAG